LIITYFIPIDPKSTVGKAALFTEKGERIIEKAKYDMVIVVKKVDEKKKSVHVDVHLSKFSSSLFDYYNRKNHRFNDYTGKKIIRGTEKH